jgi:hypothetical protein
MAVAGHFQPILNCEFEPLNVPFASDSQPIAVFPVCFEILGDTLMNTDKKSLTIEEARRRVESQANVFGKLRTGVRAGKTEAMSEALSASAK